MFILNNLREVSKQKCYYMHYLGGNILLLLTWLKYNNKKKTVMRFELIKAVEHLHARIGKSAFSNFT